MSGTPASVEDGHRQAEAELAQLRRIGEQIAAGMAPEARDEAKRAWINRVLRAVTGSRL